MPTVEEFWAELDSLGEKEVRRKLIVGDYRDMGVQRDAVSEWLRQREEARQRARDRRILNWTIVGAVAAIVAAVAAIAALSDSRTIAVIVQKLGGAI